MKPIAFSCEILERSAAAAPAADGTPERRVIRFVASTGKLDRFDSKIVPAGIQLAGYKRNPIILWNHDFDTPIARASNITLENNRLTAEAVFPRPGVDAQADRVYSLIQEEIINAASVRLRPTKSRPINMEKPFEGRIYEESELLELSFVSVPGNSEALIVARGANDDDDEPTRQTGANSNHTGVTSMHPLQALQRQRDHILSQHQALSSMAETRALSDEEMATLNGYTTDISGIDQRITQAQAIEQQRAAMARPVEMHNDVSRMLISHTPVQVLPMARQMGPGEAFGLFARALAANKGIPQLAAQWVERETGQMGVARALSTATASAGGTLVPVEYAREFIDLLRPLSVVRRAGPRTLEFRGAGSLRIPKVVGGATASYVGENQRIQYSEMTTDAIVMTPKKLAAITALSNELIRRSNPSADAIVRDDLLAAVAQTSDAQFLRGVGSSTSPAGLAAMAAAGNIFAATLDTGAATVDTITADTSTALLKLRNAQVRMTRPHWFMSPTTEVGLRRRRDGNGNFLWRDEMNQGRFEGFPFSSTTQMPANLGDDEDQSQLILADMADVILAEEMDVAVDVSSEAAYVDGSNNLISAFSHDQTVVRVITTHDFGVRYSASIAVINEIIW
jgi:HK97 family phage major capsid protein/HK97 family phage prohead protease